MLTFVTLLLFLIGCKKDLDMGPTITVPISDFTVDYHYQSVTVKFSITTDWKAFVTYENADQAGWLLSEGTTGTDLELTRHIGVNSTLTDRKFYVTIFYADKSHKLTFTQKALVDEDLTTLFDINFAYELQKRRYIPNATKIMRSDVIAIESLNLSGGDDYVGTLTSLLGIEHFEILGFLYCSKNQLTALDLSQNRYLNVLYCSENQLTALDFSKNRDLRSLYCSNNRLSSIDVSKNTYLNTLWCTHNQLKTLDISKNINLDYFSCTFNPGNGAELLVKSGFDKQSIPRNFTSGEWIYNHQTINIKYQKID